jgi:hypothetical protein
MPRTPNESATRADSGEPDSSSCSDSAYTGSARRTLCAVIVLPARLTVGSDRACSAASPREARTSPTEGSDARASTDGDAGSVEDRECLRCDRRRNVAHGRGPRDGARDPLEPFGLLARAVIGLEQHRALECECRLVRERLHEPALVRGERPGLLARESEGPHRTFPDEERDGNERSLTARFPDALGDGILRAPFVHVSQLDQGLVRTAAVIGHGSSRLRRSGNTSP